MLATLVKLKQVCNHPAQFLGDNSALPGRSGKLARLTEMLEEVLAVGDRALIFTQFAEMGELLQRHLQETFGREVLFLHGGVPKEAAGRAWSSASRRSDGPRLLLLSLKAGGTGLNLTRANHVFHFRPLVESGGGEPGHRPRLSHRARRERPGAQVPLCGDAGGEDRRDDRAEAGGRRAGRRRRRGLADGAIHASISGALMALREETIAEV